MSPAKHIKKKAPALSRQLRQRPQKPRRQDQLRRTKNLEQGQGHRPRPSRLFRSNHLQRRHIGVLYEPGYKSIRFIRPTLEELTDGKDSLSIPYKAVN